MPSLKCGVPTLIAALSAFPATLSMSFDPPRSTTGEASPTFASVPTLPRRDSQTSRRKVCLRRWKETFSLKIFSTVAMPMMTAIVYHRYIAGTA